MDDNSKGDFPLPFVIYDFRTLGLQIMNGSCSFHLLLWSLAGSRGTEICRQERNKCGAAKTALRISWGWLGANMPSHAIKGHSLARLSQADLQMQLVESAWSALRRHLLGMLG